MVAGVSVDVGAVIDRSRFSQRQLAIVALCGLLMVLDGYDSGEIAFVGPSLLREWHLQPSMLTLLFTVNGLAQIIAALFFGPVTDRYGRRWLMIAGTAFTGIGSAFGIGRIGTIIGPIYGGMVMSLALPVGDAFLLGAIPAAISSAGIIVLSLLMRPMAPHRAVSTLTT